MRSVQQFSVIDAHTAGAPVRVCIGGLPKVPGATVADKRDWLRENRDELRTLLMYEPRGHAAMSGSLLVEPGDPRADIGIVFMEVSGWLPMCGHGTIGTVTALIEAGMVPVQEPETLLTVEVPAGLIQTRVQVRDGIPESVTIENVPAYVAAANLALDVPGYGSITVDIAYGGNYYAIVDAAAFGLQLEPGKAREILEAATATRQAVQATLDPVHPRDDRIRGVSHVMLTEPIWGDRLRGRNTILYGEVGIGRDPCGTGTCARLALLHARGQIELGQEFIHEGLLGTEFSSRIHSTTQLGDHDAIVPSVSGSAYVTGVSTLFLDPRDPFPKGFGVGYGQDVALRPRRAT